MKFLISPADVKFITEKYLRCHVDDMVERKIDDAVIVFMQVIQQRSIHHEFRDDIHWLRTSADAHQLHQFTMP